MTASTPPSASRAQGHARVLFVDDEEDVREVFAAVFGGDFDVSLAASGPDALVMLSAGSYDVIVSDMRMDPMRGSELLALAYDRHRDVQRILLTGFSDHKDLVDAVNRGHVFAYVQKPWDMDQLRLTIQRAAEARKLEEENRRLIEELRIANSRLKDDVEVVSRVVGPRPRMQVSSPAMARVLEQIMAVAGTEASVLLHGETGVGKELVAAAIHERSARKRGRFVAQNLAALPPELLTSELFGHVKGAFTGAQGSRRGLFELADGGTLFLDEIGEAPASLQAMLLRALESREIWPVGGSEPKHVDLRIIAATNRDLLAEAKAGTFRLDLYYRLAVAPIHIPPLRERPQDVRGLGAPMLESASRRMGRMIPRLTEGAWQALERHTWPGNVRELSNVMERLAIYHASREVDAHHLGLPPAGSVPPPAESTAHIGSPYAPRPSQPPLSNRPSAPPGAPRIPAANPTLTFPSAPRVPSQSPSSTRLPSAWPSAAHLPGDPEEEAIHLKVPEAGTTFDELEREILLQVLQRADGNQSRAARSLGLSESTLRSRLKRLGLKG